MNYYTYGKLPTEIWPIRHNPPLSQYAQERDQQMFGEAEELAGGGLAALGGGAPVEELGGAAPLEGPVAGPGSGREDLIPARLSDGEYVFDAETVALLGDGSVEQGARLLDQMREAIRAHKGQALAKGKISPDAKAPLDYLDEAE